MAERECARAMAEACSRAMSSASLGNMLVMRGEVALGVEMVVVVMGVGFGEGERGCVRVMVREEAVAERV